MTGGGDLDEFEDEDSDVMDDDDADEFDVEPDENDPDPTAGASDVGGRAGGDDDEGSAGR